MSSTSQATVINSAGLAKSVRSEAAARLSVLHRHNPAFQPHLAVIHLGDSYECKILTRLKSNAAREVGIKYKSVALPADASLDDVIRAVEALNSDPSVTGIQIKLPLGPHINFDGERAAMEAISPAKDVEGFQAQNIGHLYSRACKPTCIPATQKGVMRLLELTGISLDGASAVVLGRSDILGNPVTVALRNSGATVTQCHSRTKNLPSIIERADVLVCAIGRPEFVQGFWLKPGAVVIDAGINYLPDPTAKTGNRLVGDVDFASAVQVASYITPVPGGVGPMSIAYLMVNTVEAAERLCLSNREIPIMELDKPRVDAAIVSRPFSDVSRFSLSVFILLLSSFILSLSSLTLVPIPFLTLQRVFS